MDCICIKYHLIFWCPGQSKIDLNRRQYFLFSWLYFIHSYLNHPGYDIHHLLYWLFTSYTLAIELSFDFIVFAFCCYVSYEIDCYNEIVVEIGQENSKWEFDELLKTLVELLIRVSKFVQIDCLKVQNLFLFLRQIFEYFFEYDCNRNISAVVLRYNGVKFVRIYFDGRKLNSWKF